MMLESVKDDDKKLATLRKLIPELKDEMRYTNNLFENLLNWSKLQLKETSISNQPVNISELTFKIAESLRPKASEKGVVINSDMSETYIKCRQRCAGNCVKKFNLQCYQVYRNR